MGFIAHHETEGGTFLSFMNAIIVSEFGEREVFYPRVGIFATVDTEVGLKFLIHAFSLSVSLRVISSREGIRVLKETTKF